MTLNLQTAPKIKNRLCRTMSRTVKIMHGIKAAYLGSAQLDRQAKDLIFCGDRDVSIILVTPEWMAKSDKKAKLQRLVDQNKVCLITLDEAHLFHY